ncbi:MAG: hypothetical protein JW818_07315 [Pirellulales bacterium]|nr:hypothetical protein [Pirellulales bacterium]
MATKSYRGVIRAVIFLLVGMTAAAVAAAVWVYWPLPDPAEADRDALFQWLVTRDLSQESYQTRRVLARRLDEETQSDIAWDDVGDQISEPYRKQLWANIPLLLQPWLRDKIDAYYATPPADRPAFLDNVLDTVTRWNGLKHLCPEGDDFNLTAMLLTQIKDMQAKADPTERAQINGFLLAVQARWWFRGLTGQLPKRKP